MHLVEQLLLAGSQAELAARAIDLAEQRRAVLRHIRPGEAEAGEIGDILVSRIGEIPAGELAAAFQQMADDCGLAQSCPVSQCPAEGVHHGGNKQRRIAAAAGDDHIRPAAQCRDDRLDAEIGVGGDHRGAQITGGAGLIDQGDGGVADGVENVIAEHGRHLETVKAERLCGGEHGAGGGGGVGCTHVGDDLDAARMAMWQHGFHPLDQQWVEPGVGVTQARCLGEGDGAFGEAFEHQIVEPAMACELHRRFDPVAAKTGPCSHPDPHCRLRPCA